MGSPNLEECAVKCRQTPFAVIMMMMVVSTDEVNSRDCDGVGVDVNVW